MKMLFGRMQVRDNYTHYAIPPFIERRVNPAADMFPCKSNSLSSPLEITISFPLLSLLSSHRHHVRPHAQTTSSRHRRDRHRRRTRD